MMQGEFFSVFLRSDFFTSSLLLFFSAFLFHPMNCYSDNKREIQPDTFVDPSVYEPIKRSPLEEEEKIDILVTTLNEGNWNERYEARKELLDFVELPHLIKLVKLLRKGNNPHTQVVIAEALGKIGDPRALKALEFELRNGSIEAKRAVVKAFGEIGSDWPVPILFRLATREKTGSIFGYKHDERIVAYSFVALAKIQTPKAIDAFKKAFDSVWGKSRSRSQFMQRMVEEAAMRLPESANFLPSQTLRDVDKKDFQLLPRGKEIRLWFKGIPFYFFQPLKRTKEIFDSGSRKITFERRPWLLVCLPNSSFNGKGIFKQCKEIATRGKTAVVVPDFNPYDHENLGNFNFRARRLDKYLMELIEAVGKKADLNYKEVFMIGEGIGGDFVHRFSMMYPKKIITAVATPKNPLEFNFDNYFPKGFKANPDSPDLRIDPVKALRLKLVLRPHRSQGFSVRKIRMNDNWWFMMRFKQFTIHRGMWPRAFFVKSEHSGSIPGFLFGQALLD